MDFHILADARLPPDLVIGSPPMQVRSYLHLMIEIKRDCAINFGKFQRWERLLNCFRGTPIEKLRPAFNLKQYLSAVELKAGL
jgi:hypothetical protein